VTKKPTAGIRRFVRCALVVLLWPPMSLSGQVVEPGGYRTEDYRAPTPATLNGARVVTTAEAKQIWKAGGAIFLDVLPHAPRPANLPPGTIWREKPRRNIPGSSWLPDIGYGALAPVTENYLRTNLARVTGGDQTKALVVYCLRDCWMSWNAAKRILAMGYINVVWYPDGSRPAAAGLDTRTPDVAVVRNSQRSTPYIRGTTMAGLTSEAGSRKRGA
jgi:PQQ-dependent catabolism-associated CXXCW motif protein